MSWSAEKAKAAVSSLSRIRAAESEPDKQGIKTVWHHGADGADLVSYVDAAGVVTEQALTLLTDHFVWTAKVGLRTGAVGPGHGSRAAAASDAVALDRQLSSERILRADQALGTYAGSDRYIKHIKGLLGRARQGLQSYEGEEVTDFISPASLEKLRELPATAGDGRRRRVLLVVFGAVLAALFAALLATC